MTDFKKLFIGEYVEILSNARNIIQGDILPLSVQGYILDMDDDFLYVGETPLEIKFAVKREDVRYLEIIEPKTIFDHMLDQTDLSEQN